MPYPSRAASPLVPVFNLSQLNFSLTLPGQSNVISIPAREWYPIPRNQSYFLLNNYPNLLIDYGRNSITSQKCKHIEGGKRHLNLTSILDAVTGYGNASEQLLRALFADDKNALTLTRSGYWHPDALSPEVVALMQANAPKPRFSAEKVSWDTHPSEQNLDLPPRWSIAVTIPPEIRKAPSPRKLLYTMWECDTIPQRENYLLTGNEQGKPSLWYHDLNAWPEWINFYADILAVPCQDQKQSFERAKVSREPHVVPLGVNSALYFYEPRKSVRRTLDAIRRNPVSLVASTDFEKRDKFTILVYGELSARKGIPEILIDVVWPVLQHQEDWQLILKTRGNTKSLMSSISDDRVHVICSDWLPTQMAELAHYADCGLALSHYEGWGMPFREMMASGLPVIVSDCSGHREDTHPDYNRPIPCPEKLDALTIHGQWYEPDWEAARVALSREYEDWKRRDGKQSPLGERAAQWIRARRPWSATANQLLSLIDRYEARQ